MRALYVALTLGSAWSCTHVNLVRQASIAKCIPRKTFGCESDGIMYVRGCRGQFRCVNGPIVECGFPPGLPRYRCFCNGTIPHTTGRKPPKPKPLPLTPTRNTPSFRIPACGNWSDSSSTSPHGATIISRGCEFCGTNFLHAVLTYNFGRAVRPFVLYHLYCGCQQDRLAPDSDRMLSAAGANDHALSVTGSTSASILGYGCCSKHGPPLPSCPILPKPPMGTVVVMRTPYAWLLSMRQHGRASVMLSSAGRLLADAKRVRASNARPSEKAIAGDQKAIARLITTIERMNFSSFLRSDNSKLLRVWASYASRTRPCRASRPFYSAIQTCTMKCGSRPSCRRSQLAGASP